MRTLLAILICLMALGILTGCGNGPTAPDLGRDAVRITPPPAPTPTPVDEQCHPWPKCQG